MLLNLFEIIHHAMLARDLMNTLWLFPVHVAALVLEIINFFELIICIQFRGNMPNRIHQVKINQITINYILVFRNYTRVTAF
jgi:hypothetical protein